jgi:hypothetical protein
MFFKINSENQVPTRFIVQGTVYILPVNFFTPCLLCTKVDNLVLCSIAFFKK